MERRQATVLAADEANVEHALDDMAARTALHSIETLTLSDTQFLRGDANGKATTTSGQLRLAKGSGRFAAWLRRYGA